MHKNILVIAAALMLFVNFAEAKTPERAKAGLLNTLNQRMSRTVTWYRKANARLLKDRKARKKLVAFCVVSKADFDSDGDVDGLDQKFFSYCFDTGGKGLGCKAADLTNDNIVNLSDLIAFGDEKQKSGDITRADLCVVLPGVTDRPQ